MFSALAPDYERFNRWSSLGLDGVWRRALIRETAPAARVLDLGTGTGDLPRRAGRAGWTGLDISFEMLAAARPAAPGAGWVQASAENLPFSAGSFDAAVSAFVLRNLQKAQILETSLAEIRRVLRPTGRLIFLDLTRPRFAPLRWGHGVYLRTALPAVGRAVFGPRWPGDYLKSSIDELWPEARLREAFESAGFGRFQVRPLWGGVVSLFAAE
jgi:demethylmenaquinone methyltransferase / 2-methoxy-6-polyprenyl-1,4-benzoquinol methylase